MLPFIEEISEGVAAHMLRPHALVRFTVCAPGSQLGVVEASKGFTGEKKFLDLKARSRETPVLSIHSDSDLQLFEQVSSHLHHP